MTTIIKLGSIILIPQGYYISTFSTIVSKIWKCYVNDTEMCKNKFIWLQVEECGLSSSSEVIMLVLKCGYSSSKPYVSRMQISPCKYKKYFWQKEYILKWCVIQQIENDIILPLEPGNKYL